MREIIFRGKRKDNGEWVYGDLIHYACNNGDIGIDNGFLVEDENDIETFDVIPETIGQYTGLTANGTKIFENGYIIIDNKTYKVTFNNAEYILTNIFNCDIITLKNNSIKGVFVDEI
jgi:hypothetical protein